MKKIFLLCFIALFYSCSNYLTEEDELLQEEELTKENIKSLLKKYNLEDGNRIVDDIYNNKTTFFDQKFKLKKRSNSGSRGFGI